jgi:hypothetical protein
MKLKQLAIIPLMLVFMSPVNADLYLELAIEGGGEDLIGSTTGDVISAGGGIKFAGGIQNPINNDGTASIRLSLGYLFDSIDAFNGNADLDTLTFDALYLVHSGPHTFGFGGTMHMDPEYTDNVAGFSPLKIEFDDAFGVVLQYGYHFVPGLEVGLRLTEIDYESGATSIDAGSFGIFISNGF